MYGIILALLAYLIWGAFPLYFSYLSQVPPIEILANRIIWAFLVTVVFIQFVRKNKALLTVLKNGEALKWLLLSAILITINWLVFIWAVSNERVLESSLGYFMTPLVSLILGRIFFQEKINRLQVIAALLATTGVYQELIALGRVPWVSLVLALSFGFYGLVRKYKPVDSLVGLTIETLLIMPFAGIYFFWYQGTLAFGQELNVSLLLMASGLITAIPLILFASAAKRLDLTVVGFMMYINPSMQFLTAVYIFNEPFNIDRLASFILIWTAMGFFTAGLRKKTSVSRIHTSN